MQMLMAMLMNAAEYLGSPIDGPPTDVAEYIYSGTKIGYTWVVGDVDAQVQVSIDGGTTVDRTFAPKTVDWATGYTETAWDAAGYTFAVRHIDGIYTSAWVEDTGGL
jgi:hypothetical protein